MRIHKGKGKTEFGPGVQIDLTGDEVAVAVYAYLVAQRVYVQGPRTVTINGELIKDGSVYVDPTGYVIRKGQKISGR